MLCFLLMYCLSFGLCFVFVDLVCFSLAQTHGSSKIRQDKILTNS